MYESHIQFNIFLFIFYLFILIFCRLGKPLYVFLFQKAPSLLLCACKARVCTLYALHVLVRLLSCPPPPSPTPHPHNLSTDYSPSNEKSYKARAGNENPNFLVHQTRRNEVTAVSGEIVNPFVCLN